MINPFFKALLAMQEGIEDLKTEDRRSDPHKGDRPAADPHYSAGKDFLAATSQPRFYYGTVTGVVPSSGCYRVATATGSGSPPILCNRLLCDSSVSPIAARPVECLEPGTTVLIIVLPKSRIGTIIGVIPGYVSTPDTFVHPEVSPASGMSQPTDQFFTSHLSASQAGVINYSCGSPVDATVDGKGWISPLGPGVYSDTNQAFVRASVSTGFWAISIDDTVRMVGKTLQVWTDGFSIDGWNDQDATTTVTGVSLFGWEALGYFTPNVLAPTQRTSASVQMDSPEYATVEPTVVTQIPFRRIVTYAGYLGYGELKIVQIPPAAGDGPLSVGGDDRPLVAGMDHVAVDGSRTITSARSILIAHTPLLHAPTPQANPYDPAGLVRPSGVVGAGQKIGSEPTSNAAGTSCGLTVDDQVAFARMWRSGNGFFYDAPDWTPVSPRGTPTTPPSFDDLIESQFTPIVSEMARIDHRHSVPFFATTSFFHLAADGRVVIAGPSGEEIRMGGGTIELLAPGDIILRGRNIVTMAGRTNVIMANDSVEVTASSGSVKVKADKDAQVLAGNSGVGTLILESRSELVEYDYAKEGDDTRGGGVVVKSANQVAIIGGNVYARTTTGSLVLDASQGAQDVVTIGAASRAWLVDGAYEYFGDQGNLAAAAYRSGSVSIVPGDIRASGNLITKENVYSGGGMYAADGTFASGQAKQTEGKVQELQDESLSAIRDTVNEVDTTETQLTETGQDLFDSDVTAIYYQPNQIGDSDTFVNVGFRFRTSAQYRTLGYTMFEARWAQQARLRGLPVSTWVEFAVAGPEGETYPFPGEAMWTSATYATLDPKLYDPATGEPRPAGQEYVTAVEELQVHILNGAIPIT